MLNKLEFKKFNFMINNMQHCIGYDFGRIKRHKYEYYRNYFSGNNEYLDIAVNLGFCRVTSVGSYGNNYCVTADGFEFLQNLLKVKIVKRDD